MKITRRQLIQIIREAVDLNESDAQEMLAGVTFTCLDTEGKEMPIASKELRALARPKAKLKGMEWETDVGELDPRKKGMKILNDLRSSRNRRELLTFGLKDIQRFGRSFPNLGKVIIGPG